MERHVTLLCFEDDQQTWLYKREGICLGRRRPFLRPDHDKITSLLDVDKISNNDLDLEQRALTSRLAV